MPVYEYDCVNCKKQYSFARSIKEEDPGYFCNECGLILHRSYSNVGVIFNANGFYSKDNRKK
jgi:putative FmdB family regulatory protein